MSADSRWMTMSSVPDSIRSRPSSPQHELIVVAIDGEFLFVAHAGRCRRRRFQVAEWRGNRGFGWLVRVVYAEARTRHCVVTPPSGRTCKPLAPPIQHRLAKVTPPV